MDESFVVLGPASAPRSQNPTLHGPDQQHQPHAEGAGLGGGGGGSPAVGLDSKLQVLSKLFDMASLETQVRQQLPLGITLRLSGSLHQTETDQFITLTKRHLMDPYRWIIPSVLTVNLS